MGLLREPLLHFFLLGAGLFALVSATRDVGRERSDHIVVTAGQVERLTAAWEQTWRRSPTPQELDALIEDHIDEEVLYREALALDLDKNDIIIRRRLRQKMEFVAQDLAPPEEPPDEALLARLQSYPDDYRLPARFSFVHVYFSPDRRGASTGTDAAAVLARLTGADPVDSESLGDPLPLPQAFSDVDAREIDRLLGQGFAAQLEAADVGAWSGPLTSGYGLHLVWIDAHTPARSPELGEVRDRLRQDWLAEARDKRQRTFINALRSRYEISVERPEQGPSDALPDVAEPEDG